MIVTMMRMIEVTTTTLIITIVVSEDSTDTLHSVVIVVTFLVSGVIMMSGGQVEPLALKVTSARCTQLEVEARLNTKVSTGRIELTVRDMHTLTRESQEVVVGKILVRRILLSDDVEVALKRLIVLSDIPHSGQLNITTSTLPIPV